MTLYILLGIIISITIAGIAFLHQPSFGRLPKGERLERIKRSPNYREGEFRNIDTTILMTSHKSRLSGIWSFLFRKVEGLRPDEPIPAIKTALRKIPLEENALVWFGHSSYLLQVDEKRILVDPVVLYGFARIVRQQTFPRDRNLFSRRHARHRLPRYFPRPLGPLGLSYGQTIERPHWESSLSIGCGRTLRTLGFR